MGATLSALLNDKDNALIITYLFILTCSKKHAKKSQIDFYTEKHYAWLCWQ